MPRCVLANACEEKFACLAEARGWRPTKRGWPDFAVFEGNKLVAVVEVKPRLASSSLKLLRKDQVAIMATLEQAGVECYVSDGDIVETFDYAIHAAPSRRRSKGR